MKIFPTLLFALLLTINANGQIVTEGNIAKYYFNNGNANDDIGTNDGVIYGALLSNDRFGNTEHAFEFNNDFIRIDHDDVLDLGMDEFSISAWFKTENDNSYGVIFNKGEGSASKPRIFIRTMESPQSTFQWRVGDGTTNITETYTDSSFFDNEWHHIVIVKKSSSLTLYLDADVKDFSFNNLLSQINTNSNRPILIGVQDSIFNSSGNVPFGNYFDGQLDDYRIYNRAINDLEVDSLYNEGNPVLMTNTLDLASDLEFSIVPNPAINNIYINAPSSLNSSCKFIIFNTQGKIALKGKIENSEIDLTSINPGMYFLQIISQDNKIGTKKLIKMKN